MKVEERDTFPCTFVAMLTTSCLFISEGFLGDVSEAATGKKVKCDVSGGISTPVPAWHLRAPDPPLVARETRRSQMAFSLPSPGGRARFGHCAEPVGWQSAEIIPEEQNLWGV